MILHGIDKTVLNLNGEEMKTQTDKVLTYKSLLTDTILAQTNEKVGGLTKKQCYDLARKLNKTEKDFDFKLSEIKAIQAIAEIAWPVYIFGVLDDFIENGGIRDEKPVKVK